MDSNEDLAQRLAGRLRRLRKAAGLSGTLLGEQLGWTQSKISKIENGRTTPSDRDIIEWAKATNADADEMAELLAMLTEVRAEQESWENKFRRGQALTQREYDRLARKASVIRNFETAAVPGLLQTSDYARHRIMEGVRRQGANPSPAEVDRVVAARVGRSEVLRDTSKLFAFLLAEPVLRWRLAPADIQRRQFEHLLALAELPNVVVDILPFAARIEDTPQHGFIMFDDVAIAETLTSEEVCRDAKAKKYADVFAYFMTAAVSGDEARRLITAAMRVLD